VNCLSGFSGLIWCFRWFYSVSGSVFWVFSCVVRFLCFPFVGCLYLGFVWLLKLVGFDLLCSGYLCCFVFC